MSAGEGSKGDPKPDLSAMRTLAGDDPSAKGRQLKPGDVFAGRFRIDAHIGTGGAGDVYRAHDTRLNRSIALKLIRSDRLVSSEAHARLMQEAATARDIRHPNVIAVYDADEFDRQPFLTMEHLEGQTMRSWMREQLHSRTECSLEAAIAVVSAILDGLEAAHALGITHRDLKPENVFFIRPPGANGVKLKLLDFGLASIAGTQTDSTASAGTPHYMAPEQITAPDTAAASADIYSLSKIFYELLAGVLPLDHWQPPGEGRTDVPPAIDDLIRKGLSAKPRLRPQSVADYRVELGNALGKVAAPAAPSTPALSKPPIDTVAAEDLMARGEAMRLQIYDKKDAKDHLGTLAAYDETKRLLSLAAETGDPRGKLAYAQFLAGSHPHVAGRDWGLEDALPWGRSAAEDGLVDAMVWLGERLQMEVIFSDPKGYRVEALAWFKKAGEAGSVDGWLGAAHTAFVAASHQNRFESAWPYWEKALAMNSGEAMCELGEYYSGELKGCDTPKDRIDMKLAREWYDRAQKAGYKGVYMDDLKKKLGVR